MTLCITRWLSHRTCAALLGAFFLGAAEPAGATPAETFLWQIGRPDHNNAESALAPDGWRKFRDDGLFIVGESDAKHDWPYVHPGPGDAWAGGASHTFAIVFGLNAVPAVGDCRLQVALVDTQSRGAPSLRIRANTRPSLGHPEASLGASWPSDRYADRARGIAGRNVASHGEWIRLRFATSSRIGTCSTRGPSSSLLRRARRSAPSSNAMRKKSRWSKAIGRPIGRRARLLRRSKRR